MTPVSLTLSTPDPTDAAPSASVHRIARAAAAVDGYAPFNEQSLLDLAAGRRAARLLLAQGEAVGAAIVGAGELDLVVEPEHRGRGHATAALAAILDDREIAQGPLTAWSHGDHPAARALAARFGFEAVRTLLQLRLSPLEPRGAVANGAPAAPAPVATAGTDVTVDRFRPGRDDDEWIALNARVFASHPEQGRMTVADLADRRAESWFDADDFLIARDAEGRMIGFNWLKVDAAEQPGVGEVYVLGISPESAGRGVGRALMGAGLDRLRERGIRTVDLYVEADNTRAVELYRSHGFTNHTVDVQYRRIPG